jgi:hypothetical protein
VAGGGETQILRGPGLDVTACTITFAEGSIAAADASAPQLENTISKMSVMPTLLAIAATFALTGFVLMFPPLWISGLALAAFSPVMKISRRVFRLSVESGGHRMVVYTTAKEDEAKLALAAVIEAMRRANGLTKE